MHKERTISTVNFECERKNFKTSVSSEKNFLEKNKTIWDINFNCNKKYAMCEKNQVMHFKCKTDQ